MIEITIGVRTFYRMEAFNPATGKTRILSDWFGNTVLDSGRNYIGSNGNWLTACQVGTAATPAPSSSDTGLSGYFAGTSNIIATQSGAQPSAPYYGWLRETYEFVKGTTATPLSEVALGWQTTGNTFTRALIEVGGVPTTITPLADEILRVTAETRYYPPITPVAGTVTLKGLIYDTSTIASEVTSIDAQAGAIGTEIGVRNAGTPSEFAAYDDEIGTIEQAPSGTPDNIDGTPSNTTYSNNSYQRDMVIACGANGWNLGSGIRSIQITTSAGKFQTRFGQQGGGDETIPKTTGQSMSLTYRINWIEGTIP